MLSIKIKRATVDIESKKILATTEISIKQQMVDMQIYVKLERIDICSLCLLIVSTLPFHLRMMKIN